jgi:hypothetical protein
MATIGEILERLWDDLVKMDLKDPETLVLLIVLVILGIAIIKAI